jgi:hypothetical protein
LQIADCRLGQVGIVLFYKDSTSRGRLQGWEIEN